MQFVLNDLYARVYSINNCVESTFDSAMVSKNTNANLNANPSSSYNDARKNMDVYDKCCEPEPTGKNMQLLRAALSN
ncbi:unnamed protein product [Rhizophagus irregularis]|nr:unnamed protein product [Rhizophagus irregularis]